MPGVIDFVDQNDIDGLNSVDGVSEVEPLFSTGRIEYAGQAIGLIIADTFEHAREAAQAVIITYANEQPPVLSIKDAIGSRNRVKCLRKLPPLQRGKTRGTF